MKELVILSPDRKGLLADVSELLAEHQINVEYISAQSISDKAAIQVVTSDDEKASKVLQEAGFEVLSHDTLVLKMEDKIGELAKASRMLSDADIDILHVLILKKEGKNVLVSFKVDKPVKAEKVLEEYL